MALDETAPETTAGAGEPRAAPLPRTGGRRDRRPGAPQAFALVLVSLLALALLPVLVEYRKSLAWSYLVEVTEPAHALAGEVQVALALEAAGTRGYLLTGEEVYRTTHQEARVNRRQAYHRLLALAPRLGEVTDAALAELGGNLRPADALLDSLYGGLLTRDGYMQRLPEQHARFRAVTLTASRLHEAIGGEEAARRREIRAAERLEAYLSGVLVLLALVAVVRVARLERGFRRLAWAEGEARGQAEQARAEAERRREEVERVSRSRTALMRGFGHDVKNPLGAADGYLALLDLEAGAPLTRSQTDGVARARRLIHTAVDLIDDLLELAVAEAGEMQVHLGPTDLCEVARRVVAECEPLAAGKRLSLQIETPAVFPPLESDGARIGQILGNLVGNAIKYTASGGITVRVELRPGRREDDAPRWATVSVSDTGPGLTAEEQRLAFVEFRRLPSAAGTSGAGIGLAISRRVARALGGDVTVHSEPGKGSTFVLWLAVVAPGLVDTDIPVQGGP